MCYFWDAMMVQKVKMENEAFGFFFCNFLYVQFDINGKGFLCSEADYCLVERLQKKCRIYQRLGGLC